MLVKAKRGDASQICDDAYVVNRYITCVYIRVYNTRYSTQTFLQTKLLYHRSNKAGRVLECYIPLKFKREIRILSRSGCVSCFKCIRA